MLSIIVCSRTNTLSESFSSNVAKTVGVPFELICIDNSSNKHSISQAYNLGISKSKFQYLCFVHEDVFFNSNDWGVNLIKHLNVPKVGIVGLAGGDAALRVLYDYAALHPSANITHVDKKGKVADDYILAPDNYAKSTRSVLLLDGVFLCGKREIFEKIKFDDTLSDFHGYDYDISLQSIVAGFRNYVMYDISVDHYSRGNFNATFYTSLMKVFKKWDAHLPMFEGSISVEEQKRLAPIYEKKAIKKLVKKLVRASVKTKDIVEIYTFYSKITESKKHQFFLNFLKMRIYYVRVNSILRKKIL